MTSGGAGPFVGRAEIARAYAEQPPTDTMTVGGIDSFGSLDTIRASLQVAFDD